MAKPRKTRRMPVQVYFVNPENGDVITLDLATATYKNEECLCSCHTRASADYDCSCEAWHRGLTTNQGTTSVHPV